MGNYFRLLLYISVIGAFLVRGNTLTRRAFAYLRQPDRAYTVSPIWDASMFTEDGQEARRVAVRFWRIGGIVVCVCLYLLSKF